MGVDVAERGYTRRSRPAQWFTPDHRAGAKMSASLADQLAALSAGMEQHALRSAAYAGAQVLSSEVETRVAPMSKSGLLRSAIYHVHVARLSGPTRQVYEVGVNKGKAPHWHQIEYGHWRINVVVRGKNGELITLKQRLPQPAWLPAHPYLRPAWNAKAREAIEAMQRRLAQRIGELPAGEA